MPWALPWGCRVWLHRSFTMLQHSFSTFLCLVCHKPHLNTHTHWQHFHYVMKLRSFIASHNVEQGIHQLSNQNEKKKLHNAKDCNRFLVLYQLRRQIPTVVRAGKIPLCARPTMQQPIPSCQISLQNKITKWKYFISFSLPIHEEQLGGERETMKQVHKETQSRENKTSCDTGSKRQTEE